MPWLDEEPEPFTIGAMAAQSAMGLALGAALGLAGGAIGAGMADCEEEQWACGFGEALLGMGAGYAFGNALGVWGVGRQAEGRGSFTATLLGASLGTFFGIGAAVSLQGGNGAFPLALLFGLPNAAAPTPGLRRRTLSLRTDIILARW
jgi:hypothetical protein